MKLYRYYFIMIFNLNINLSFPFPIQAFNEQKHQQELEAAVRTDGPTQLHFRCSEPKIFRGVSARVTEP